MRIDITNNAKQVLKGMEQHYKQVPYAISRALNDTAKEVSDAETIEIKRKVDRPTPFTMRTWAVIRSSKAKLTATVYARDIQAEYLKWQVEGGTRSPKAKAIPIGRNKSIINQYGNIANKAISKRYSNKQKYFSGVPKGGKFGTPGLYERMGKGGKGKIRLIASWHDQASYAPLLDFDTVASRVVQQRFEGHLRKRIAEAVASAR